MLRLSKISKKPYWITLFEGVRIKVKPCTSALYEAASFASKQKALKIRNRIDDYMQTGSALVNIPENIHVDLYTNPETRENYINGLAHTLFVKELAKMAIMGWDGIEELPTNETIEMFMDIPPVGELFLQKYQQILEGYLIEGESSNADSNGTASEAADTNTVNLAEQMTSHAPGEEEDPTDNAVPTGSGCQEQSKDGNSGNS